MLAAEQPEGITPSVTVNDASPGAVTGWFAGCPVIDGTAEHVSTNGDTSVLNSPVPLKEGVGLVTLSLTGLAIVTLGAAAMAMPTGPQARPASAIAIACARSLCTLTETPLQSARLFIRARLFPSLTASR